MFIKYPEFAAGDARYAYAVGRIRALETKLLDRQRFDRMLEAPSADEALRVLQDTDYGIHMGELKDASEYERVLAAERKVAFDLFQKLCLDGPASSTYFCRFDFHNIKVLLKARAAEQDFSDLLSPQGEFDQTEMMEIFSEESFARLPQHLGEAALQGMEAFQSSGSPRLLDIAVDQSEHEYRLDLAHQLSNEFLLNLLRLRADIHNILTLYRTKWLSEDYKLFETAILSGGFLEKERLKQAFQEPWEGIPARFAVTPYIEIIEAGGSDVVTKGSFSRLEKADDDYLMGYLRLTKTVTFGIEPLYTYLLVKENEVRSIRMVMVGKLYGIPGQMIRERLPIMF